MFLFRWPAGRLATGWLPQMQSEKRLRGNTFCVDPDSGAYSHGRRSVSSRWQWSRSHFVQTNNTAADSSPPLESGQARKRLHIRHSRPTKHQTLTPPDALRTAPAEPPSCHRGRTDSYLQGSMQQILCASDAVTDRVWEDDILRKAKHNSRLSCIVCSNIVDTA